jgi:hypothetical protein
MSWSNLLDWMSNLKMLETNQKKGVESQVTSHCENPTLQITTVKVDGLNYLFGHNLLFCILRAKEKWNT